MALSGDLEMTLCVNYTDKFPTDLFPALIYLYCVWGGLVIMYNTMCAIIRCYKEGFFSHCIFFCGPNKDLLTIYMLDLPTRAWRFSWTLLCAVEACQSCTESVCITYYKVKTTGRLSSCHGELHTHTVTECHINRQCRGQKSHKKEGLQCQV